MQKAPYNLYVGGNAAETICFYIHFIDFCRHFYSMDRIVAQLNQSSKFYFPFSVAYIDCCFFDLQSFLS
jgi:hypothetical protein